MSKQTIEVEIPEGWRVVGYRAPRAREWYLNCVGDLIQAEYNFIGCYSFLILERDPKLDPIEVKLNPGWIVRDSRMNYFWSEEEPTHNGSEWFYPGGVVLCIGDSLSTVAFSIDLDDDWRDSKRRVK